MTWELIHINNAPQASKVVFTTQPSNVVVGASISPAVQVSVEDANGNVVTGDTSTVTLTLSSGTFASGSNTATAVASGGVATFGSLSINNAGTGYTLTAADGSLAAATSGTFNVTPAPTFTLTGPTSGTFTPGQVVQINWTADHVAAGSTVNLCYDTGTSWSNVKWIEFGQAGTSGTGTYNWNTTGVAAGTYYIGGYLWSGGKPTYSHLTQSITIQPATQPTFALTGPTSGTFTPGQTVQITWTAGNVGTGSTVNLCYDTGTSWSNVKWIGFNQAAANGTGTYNWNTTGVAAGTYYIGGYLWSGGKPTYSHLTQSITIQPATQPTFALTGPTSGTFTPGQTVQITWTAGNVGTGSTVNLCYDTGTSWSNVKWIEFNQAAANGTGTYNWNTTGVATGTYYIGGYLWSGGKPTYSHLTQSITIQAATPADLYLDRPDLRHIHARPDGPNPMDGGELRGW